MMSANTAGQFEIFSCTEAVKVTGVDQIVYVWLGVTKAHYQVYASCDGGFTWICAIDHAPDWIYS